MQDEIARVAPAFAGVDAQLLRVARDGVVLPLVDHADEIEFGPSPLGAGRVVGADPVGLRRRCADGAERRGAEAGRAARGPAAVAPVARVARRSAGGRGACRSTATRSASSPPARSTAPTVPWSSRPRSPRFAPTEPVLLVHRVDRDRIGVADGDRVRVTSARGTVELPLAADRSTPQGTAFLAVNREGPGASELVDPNEPVTDLRVETLR